MSYLTDASAKRIEAKINSIGLNIEEIDYEKLSIYDYTRIMNLLEEISDHLKIILTIQKAEEL